MKLPGTRKLIALALLVCLAANPAGGSVVIAGSALLELRHGHPHLASVVREGGHLHLVLSHEDRSHERSHRSTDWRGPHAELAHGSLSETDHVFELTSDSPLNANARRADEDPPLVLVVARTSPPAPPAVVVTHSRPEPRTADVGRLRTIVLRL